MIYNNIKEWITAMNTHSCSDKNIVPTDDQEGSPNPIQFRNYICLNCNEEFSISVDDLKKTTGLGSGQLELLKTCLETSEGRKLLGKNIIVSL